MNNLDGKLKCYKHNFSTNEILEWENHKEIFAHSYQGYTILGGKKINFNGMNMKVHKKSCFDDTVYEVIL